jgi:hypothetical protein
MPEFSTSNQISKSEKQIKGQTVQYNTSRAPRAAAGHEFRIHCNSIQWYRQKLYVILTF